VGKGVGVTHVADLEQIAGAYFGPGRPRHLRQKDALLLLTTQNLDGIAVQRPDGDRSAITAQLEVLPRDGAHSIEFQIDPANGLEARTRGERGEEHKAPLTPAAQQLEPQHLAHVWPTGRRSAVHPKTCLLREAGSNIGSKRWFYVYFYALSAQARRAPRSQIR
jgi:hypothetical protein